MRHPHHKNQEDDDLNDILELFAAQSVSCGVPGLTAPSQQPDPPRENLILSLEKFTKLMKNNEDYDTQQYEYDFLLELEDAAIDLRKKSIDFLKSSKEALSEIAEFCREIQELCQTKENYHHIVIQSRSLLSAFRKKTYYERRAVEDAVEQLQCMYNFQTAPFEERLVDSFTKLAKSLASKTVGSPSFHSIISLLVAWRKRGVSGDSCRDITRDRASWSTPVKQQRQAADPADQHNLEQIQVASSTLLHFSHHSHSPIHKILLVGGSGSGKTHICNETALHAGKDTCGMLLHYLSASAICCCCL
jgi:hypothetical protein